MNDFEWPQEARFLAAALFGLKIRQWIKRGRGGSNRNLNFRGRTFSFVAGGDGPNEMPPVEDHR